VPRFALAPRTLFALLRMLVALLPLLLAAALRMAFVVLPGAAMWLALSTIRAAAACDITASG
jgi:hypothetical protein